MNENKQIKFKRRAAALAIASCLSLAHHTVEAAGLGKLTVLSGLGQPLRAELEIAASKEEIAGMTARLAPQDAFRQAGVDFPSVLLDLQFAVEKRPNGLAVVRVFSTRPVNEPFLDMLVELNWSAGRVVREYTFLLDPPEIASSLAGKQTAEARVVDTVRDRVANERPTVPVPSARRVTGQASQTQPVHAREGDGELGRKVLPGETLRKIAGEARFEGVSLEQMLLGLFRQNPEAFIGKNINRLKAGAILKMPDQAAVKAISESEAKRVYVAQAADWNAYRQKLAAATAQMPTSPETVSGQSSAGKITAKLEGQGAPQAAAKDQVRVAKADPSGKGDTSGAVEVADQVARDKALKESQERLALLEKNIVELQKLLELKNQKLAELQQPPTSREEPRPVEAARPPAGMPEPLVKPAEPQSATPAKPEPVKDPAPKVVAQPPAPAEEPGFVDFLLADPLPLAGGAGVLALVAAYFLVKRRRGSSASTETTAAPMPSSLGPNSVFRMTGGQSVDTGNTPPQTGEFSQTGPGTIDTDEVDPVAEADVYMAYGRDTQAEEILLDAMQKDPRRTAIHAKLLEIYANRRSLKQFETLAGELYALTGGAGAEWEKIAALGRGLDPANPLYEAETSRQGGLAAAALASVASAVAAPVVPEAREPHLTAPVESPTQESQAMTDGAMSGFGHDTAAVPQDEAQELPDDQMAEGRDDLSAMIADDMTLDFDLGAQIEGAALPVGQDESDQDATIVAAPLGVDSNPLDFDLGNELSVVEKAAEKLASTPSSKTAEAASFDFDLGEVASQPLQLEESATGLAEFSPEGTLVMPPEMHIDEDDLLQSALIDPGRDAAVMTEELIVDHGDDPDAMDTVLDTPAQSAADRLPTEADLLDFSATADDETLVDTMVNLAPNAPDAMEFDVKLTDSMFLGQPAALPEFDLGSINLDLGAEPLVIDELAAPSVELPAPGAAGQGSHEAQAIPHDAQWEEVNTKLDLAKAYEEMGDLEGARELLQEVVGEGSADLVAQAQEILGRIGG